MKFFNFFKKVTHWDDSVMEQVENEYQRGGFTKKQYKEIYTHYTNFVRPHLGNTVHKTMKSEEYEGAGSFE